jgi:myo-inositol-1(or 4)-monophosphatase
MQFLPETCAAIDAARAGAKVLLRYFRGEFDVAHKETFNLVSRADTESEAAIAESLRASFPDDAFLAEEGAAAGKQMPGQNLWIIDPLDGTNNFVHGLDQFAISIARISGNSATCGVVYRPVNDEWFIAESGRGAWHNGRRVRVSAVDRFDQALLAVGFYYDRDKMMKATLEAMEVLFRQQIHGFRRLGAASLDLCLTGCGQFEGYFEFRLAPWDFAAGRLFVEEAGGLVTDCDGLSPGHDGYSSLLAAPAGMHSQILNVIRPIWQTLSQSS